METGQIVNGLVYPGKEMIGLFKGVKETPEGQPDYAIVEDCEGNETEVIFSMVSDATLKESLRFLKMSKKPDHSCDGKRNVECPQCGKTHHTRFASDDLCDKCYYGEAV